MRETLNLMKSAVLGYERTKSIEELLQEYQQNQSQNILAYIFIKYYNLINSIANKYKWLNSEDIASYSLQELDKAIMQYDFTRNCSFITYFYVLLNNKLNCENSKLKSNTQLANYSIVELPEYTEIKDNNFTYNSLLDYSLSNSQLKLCKLIISGYSSREISKIYNVSHSTICNKTKQLRKILVN